MSVEVEETSEVVDPASTLMHGVVKIKDENGKLWKEVAEVISVSSTGAGFYLKRECKPGRLVSIMIPMETHLRYYDHDKELYRVWGVVQHCHRITADDQGYHFGVAFIGKDAPESYRNDPQQSYRICGMNEDGLWKVQEAAKEFKPRKDARFYAAIDHYLAVVDPAKTGTKGERTTTENISKHGAAVFTNLDLNVGDRVKFISELYDFSGVAVVCSRRNGTDGKARLSLQFVGSTFPVERITAKAMELTKEEPVAA
jgi:hypothetical protein